TSPVLVPPPEHVPPPRALPPPPTRRSSDLVLVTRSHRDPELRTRDLADDVREREVIEPGRSHLERVARPRLPAATHRQLRIIGPTGRIVGEIRRHVPVGNAARSEERRVGKRRRTRSRRAQKTNNVASSLGS